MSLRFSVFHDDLPPSVLYQCRIDIANIRYQSVTNVDGVAIGTPAIKANLVEK